MRRLPGALLALASAGMIAAACSHAPKQGPSSNRAPSHASGSTSSSLSTTSSTPGTTVPGKPTCSNVTATAGQMQGAAGTITGVITLVNRSTVSCTTMGYPAMVLRNAGGTALPVSMVDGLTVQISAAANAAPSSVTLAPAAAAAFTYQLSDVPSGTETSCPESTTMSATAPGATSGSPPIPLVLAPCSHGTIRVSPVYAAS
ncbi:MAG TPA: DUF4232 domain-containing protein [Acidimicrobiales bacterium]|nr:DUF4232 domain-containing protein [Acidimicrobiales bacterium]